MLITKQERSTKTNNITVSKISISQQGGKPDLGIHSLIGVNVFPQDGYSILSFGFRVVNQGNAFCSGTKVRLYFSSNNLIDDSDSKIGDINIQGLAPNEVSQVYEFNNKSVADGVFIILVVDVDDTCDESNENNNNTIVTRTYFSGRPSILLNPGTPDIEEISDDKKNQLSAFPNPTSRTITFSLKNQKTNNSESEIFLYNNQGVLIFKQKVKNKPSFQLDLSKYPKGMYNLIMKSGSETVQERIVIQN